MYEEVFFMIVLFHSKIHALSLSFLFGTFGLKLSLIVILTNFSHSSNSSKLPARENLQFEIHYVNSSNRINIIFQHCHASVISEKSRQLINF